MLLCLFIFNGFRRKIATFSGVTPARKVYEYSRNIPPIPMEEDVLLNFRERLEEDSQEEDENPLNQTIDESETSNSGKVGI